MRSAKALGKFVAAVVLPLLTLSFIVLNYYGVWDACRGLHHVRDIATRLETSYAEGVKRVVRPGEPGWDAMLKLIRSYSSAQLPANREPKLLARSVAVASAKLDIGGGYIAEWTAPSTPLVLIYIEWPGQTVTPADYKIIGTIGDIRTWVDKSRADFYFVTRDVLLTITSIFLGALLWVVEHRPQQRLEAKDEAPYQLC